MVASKSQLGGEWTYLDGEGITDPAWLRLLFPGLPANLTIPPQRKDWSRLTICSLNQPRRSNSTKPSSGDRCSRRRAQSAARSSPARLPPRAPGASFVGHSEFSSSPQSSLKMAPMGCAPPSFSCTLASMPPVVLPWCDWISHPLSAILHRPGLARMTGNTIDAPGRLAEVLREIRERGYAILS